MQDSNTSESNQKFSVRSYGGLPAWAAFVHPHPKFGKVPGKQFLRTELGLTAMELSLNSLPPGKAIPFAHGHRQNEELYLFLAGHGQMLLDEQIVEVGPGTAVRVAPPVIRTWRNTGDEPLLCICIQARHGSLEQATVTDGFISENAPAWSAA